MIGLAVYTPWLLLGVPVAAFGLWLVARPKGERQWVQVGLRTLLVGLLLLALAEPSLRMPAQHRAVVAVVDLSASLAADRGLEEEQVRKLEASVGPRDEFGVVSFGRQAKVELGLGRGHRFDGFQTQPDPSASNLEAGLELASGLIPAGYGRQLVVITDGRDNLGETQIALDRLRQQGTRVDLLAAGKAAAPEVALLGLQGPSEVTAGQPAQWELVASSTLKVTAKLRVLLDGSEVESQNVTLETGQSQLPIQLTAIPEGTHELRAEISGLPAGSDQYLENNLAEAAFVAGGKPRVLLISGATGAQEMARLLTQDGLQVVMISAGQAPTSVADLAGFEGVVVDNASSEEFPPGSLRVIEEATSSMGLGLVSIGGASSYGPGGWKGTPLEKALPVKTDLPPKMENPHVAVVLLMESMESPEGNQVALQAAQSLVDSLDPEDQVGMTDANGNMAVPLQKATNRAAIKQQMAQASLGDNSYMPNLKVAGEALRKTNADLKHIIFLGDGDEATDGMQAYLEGLRKDGITTSAVLVNTHAESDYATVVQQIASWGGGRFYASDGPAQVPQMFLKEAQQQLRPWYEQQPFYPSEVVGSSVLEGLNVPSIQVDGYVVTTPRKNAQVVLESPKQDPLLVLGQYGLGRTAAWTSDSEGRWTSHLLGGQAAALLPRVVRWSLLDTRATGGVSISSTPTDGGLQVTIGSSQSGLAQPVALTVIGPDGSQQQLPAQSTGQGRFLATVPTPLAGTYYLRAQVGTGSAQLLAVRPYSPEYLATGLDQARLKVLAKGGALLGSPEQAVRMPVQMPPAPGSLTGFLLGLAILLFLIDVAERRLQMGWVGYVGLVREMVARRTQHVELGDTFERLRVLRAARQRSEQEAAQATEAATSTERKGRKPAKQPDQDSLSVLLARRRERERRDG